MESTPLATLLPLLKVSQPIVDALRRHNILTDHQLLFHPSPLHLPPDPLLTPQLLLKLKSQISDYLLPPSTTAAQIYRNLHRNTPVLNQRIIGTPFPKLDQLLGGGFTSNELIQLTGPPKSGKTTFALYVVLSSLFEDHFASTPQISNSSLAANPARRRRQDQGEALYIDTLNIFSAETALEIVLFLLEERRRIESHGRATREEEEDYDIAVSVLDRLTVSTCFDIASTLGTIEAAIALNPPSSPPPSSPPPSPPPAVEQVPNEMDTEQEGEKGRLRIVLVDSLEILFPGLEGGLAMGGNGMNGAKAQAGLVAFMRRIREVAKKENLLFLLVNPTHKQSYKAQPPPLSQFLLLPSPIPTSHSSSNSTSPIPTSTNHPTLGPTFSHLTNRTIFLSRGQDIWGNRYDAVRFSLGGEEGGRGEGRKRENRVVVVELTGNDKGEMRGWCALERLGAKWREIQ